MISTRELNELVQLKLSAADAATQFGDAVEATASLHGVNKKALRRYVTAVAADKVQELRDELAGLEQLDLDLGPRREEAA